MAETIHSFIGGMDLDTEKALRSNNVTHLVNNFRLVTNIDGTNGSLESIKGNTQVLDLEGYFDRLCGHCLVRDTLVLFGYSGAINRTSQIYKFQLSNADTRLGFPVEVYNDSKNNDNGELDFTTNIKAVGRYESADIIKVYWADGTNPVRFINIAVNNTTDGEVYNGVTNYYVGTDKLEFKPNFLVSNIESMEVKKGGSLQAGVVQYCTQLYNKYGAETLFSPLSNPLHIVEADDISTTSVKYKGSDVGTNTGKSVEITIRHLLENVGYDYMKIVRVQYTTYNGTPTIDLIADIELNKYFTAAYEDYRVIDTGVSLYNYTPEEIAITGNVLFSAKDVTTKDDLLLFGGITEDYYDADFDARAFRFSAAGSFTIQNDGAAETYTVSADTNAGWDAILDDVGDDNDCINIHNDLTYASPYQYIYQYDGTTVGGSGRNIKYEFVLESFELDSLANNTKSGSNPTMRTLSTNIGTGDNYSFTNYASPYMSQTFRGYQRGEIYRFAIVFFDAKGRSSKAKWIGDIRFPSFKDTGYDGLANFDTDHIDSDAIGITFYVRNVPTDAVAWEIVRMERTALDKTVISQGVLGSTAVSGVNRYATYFPVTKADATSYGGYLLDDDVLVYMSPDINYGELDYKVNDFFETVGYFNNYGTYTTDAANVTENVIKYSDFTLSTSTSRITPDVFKFIEVSGVDTTYTLGGVNFHNLVVRDPGELNAILGKCAVFTYTGTFVPTADADTHSCTVVNLRRINNAQYGGNTYENRFGNQYISCGNVVDSGSDAFTRASSYSATGVDIFGGDIFICMYERLHGIYYTDVAESCRVCYIPLESRYNLEIDHGTTYSRSVGVDPEVYLISENAGTHSDTATYVFEQDEDFYLYNTVYSNNITPIVYFSESNLDNNIEEYDTRVLVSDVKINNEITDSWTKFGANNFIDVDTAYGGLNNLINWKNRIFFLQDHGFGVLSINDRAIVADASSASGIVLGSGGILDRYDYISTTYGNTSLRGVVTSELGIYWIDFFKNEVLLYNGSKLDPISKTKNIDTFFKENYNQLTVAYGVYNSKYNEVWLSIYSGTTSYNVLVFSELFDKFTGFYTIPSTYFIQLNSKVWSRLAGATISIADVLYVEDSNDLRANFFGVQYDSFITLLHVEGYPNIKVYDNIEYSSTSKDSTGINIFTDTFNTVQVYNDYQNTGVVTLTKGNKLERKERRWTLAIPRNTVNKDVSDNEDIFDSANLYSTQLYKDRIRSNYSVFKFVYDNTGGYTFYVPYIKIIYRISIR